MMGTTPSTDFAITAGLEDRFCKNFSCCGITLDSLHDLLQHFEEVHVRVESDFEGMGGVGEEDDLPFEFETMDHDVATRMGRAGPPPTPHPGQHSPHPRGMMGMGAGGPSHHPHHHPAHAGGDALNGMMLLGTNNPEPKASFSALKNHQQQQQQEQQEQEQAAATAAATASATFTNSQPHQQRTQGHGGGMVSGGYPGAGHPPPTPAPSPSPVAAGPSSLLPSLPGRPLSSVYSHPAHPGTLAPGGGGISPSPSPSKEHAALALADLYASGHGPALGAASMPLQRSSSSPSQLQSHAYGGGAPLAYPPTLGVSSAFDTSVIRKRSPHPTMMHPASTHGHATAALMHHHQQQHQQQQQHHLHGSGENATIPFVFDGPTQIIHDHPHASGGSSGANGLGMHVQTGAGNAMMTTVVSMDEDGISPVHGTAGGPGLGAEGGLPSPIVAPSSGGEERPYKCKFPGCNKSYKNPGRVPHPLPCLVSSPSVLWLTLPPRTCTHTRTHLHIAHIARRRHQVPYAAWSL